MKIQSDHLQILSAAITKVREKFPEATLQYYIDNQIGKDCAMRWRWDLFHAAQKFMPDSFVQRALYSYMNDTHIDSALKFLLK